MIRAIPFLFAALLAARPAPEKDRSIEAAERKAAIDATHLNDLYFRLADSTRQWWTMPFVPGKKLAGRPVYVLTSG